MSKLLHTPAEGPFAEVIDRQRYKAWAALWPLMQAVLSDDVREMDQQRRETAFSVTQEHLNALRTRSLTAISDIEFIRQALPLYFRSTYLNGERGLLPPDTVAALDREVVDMSKELAGANF